jgi:hypothetical protein
VSDIVSRLHCSKAKQLCTDCFPVVFHTTSGMLGQKQLVQLMESAFNCLVHFKSPFVLHDTD